MQPSCYYFNKGPTTGLGEDVLADTAFSAPAQDQVPDDVPQAAASKYAWYVLSLLVLIYMLNFIDRQILSILANDIKKDLNLTDADLGFLYGTAFGVFYSLFGIPLGRLADNWNRTRLITLGLALWSSMTVLSGFARSGAELTVARIGVGIGEASASPSAYSLLSDWFPKRQRGLALSIYSSGLYLGGGLSLLIGSVIVGRWNAAYAGGGAPLGLAGWQAAFMAVGLPGLVLALWVAMMREPPRGLSDGLITPPNPRPFQSFLTELVNVIPPLTLIGALRRGPVALAVNVAVGAGIAAIAYGLIIATGGSTTSWRQWGAVGTGVYAVFSWATALRRQDPATFKLIWGTPAFLCTTLGYGLIAFNAYAVSFWAAPYAERVLGVTKVEAAWWVGAPGAAAGFIGVILGGAVADRLRQTNPAGRVLVILFGASAPIIPYIIMFTTDNATLFFTLHFVCGVFASSALGGTAATSQDLVLPRMRGVATATMFIATTLVGLSLGPYLAGFVSSISGDNLSMGMLALLAAAPVAITLLIVAYRTVPEAEKTMMARAQAAGELA
jgi:MFS family permease